MYEALNVIRVNGWHFNVLYVTQKSKVWFLTGSNCIDTLTFISGHIKFLINNPFSKCLQFILGQIKRMYY